MATKILVIDDDRSTCEVLATELAGRGFEVAWSTAPFEALERLAKEDFDLVLTDLNMSQMNGAELCKRALALRDGLPVIVMTAFGTMDAAVSAIRAGADDFITKPCNIDELVLTFEHCLRSRALRDEVKRLRRALDVDTSFDEMAGKSAPMQKVYDLIARIAETETTVLVTGESGTGKELVARAIHTRSARRAGPFIAINCAAMPEPLLESELFGHVKGAFTDARGTRSGLFVKATGGTLLLDEIGDTSTSMQAKLLRALQERRIRPVGGDDEVEVDVRIIAATNIDLETAVEEKRFREDLFYRINVLRIQVPPLRARGNDVLVLAQHFIEKYAARNRRDVVGIMSGAAEKMMSYSWPGNVRELENCIERAVALARFDRIAVDDLPDKVRDFPSQEVIVETNDPSQLLSLSEVEHRYIVRVLEAMGGSKTMAAQVLGIDRRTLYRKLERRTDDGPTSERDEGGDAS
jgi:two-component system response regulator HydG